jgi:hypothetical protein
MEPPVGRQRNRPCTVSKLGKALSPDAAEHANRDTSARYFRRFERRIFRDRDSLAERGGFEPPVPRGLLWAEIRPEFGALFGPTKSIRAGENLFALGFGFASAFSGSLRSPRLNADARRRRRSDQSSGSNPSASITVTRCPSRTA